MFITAVLMVSLPTHDMASTLHVAVYGVDCCTTSVWSCVLITAVLMVSVTTNDMASTFHDAFHGVNCCTTSVW